jgi:hypothetical protein
MVGGSMKEDNTLWDLNRNWKKLQEQIENPGKLLLEKKGDTSFCYMLYVDKDDESTFVDMQKDLKLEGELIESGKFHATVRYVKVDDYDSFVDYIKELDLPKIKCKCVEFAIYGKTKDTLVIELDGDEIHKWFKKIDKWLTDHDYPKSDFPTYKPHISLTEKAGIELPEWKKDYEKSITFSLHVVSDSNYEEVIRLKAK